MGNLAFAIWRAKLRDIPITPKLKPLPPPPPAPKRKHTIHLPGIAPWNMPAAEAPIAPVPATPSIRQIIAVVAAEFEITQEQLKGAYRTRKFTFPRHVAQYLSQRVTRQSLPTIGRVFYRDHTSVLHAVRKIARLVDEDSTVRELVERLEARIRQSML